MAGRGFRSTWEGSKVEVFLRFASFDAWSGQHEARREGTCDHFRPFENLLTVYPGAALR